MIRLATKDDSRRIGELWLEMITFHQQFDDLMFNASENGAEYYQQSIYHRLDDLNTRVLVAEIDGVVVGYVLGMIADITVEFFLPLRSGFLADIYVQEDFRNQGIGKALVERLALWFQSQDIKHFEWHVASRNKAAIRFWESIGGQTTMLRMRTTIQGDKEE